jgi:hypothetical protein
MTYEIDNGDTRGRGIDPTTLDRATFLKMLGAAGFGAAAGASLLPGEAGAEVRTSLAPEDFTFTRREQFRPFHLLAGNFVELNDGFDRNTAANYTVLAPGPERNPGTVDIRGGEAKISGERHYTVLQSNTGQEAPYAAVIVDVKSMIGSTDGPEDSVFAGLYRDADNFVAAFYNNRNEIAGFDVVSNGQVFGLGFTRADLQPPFRFAFVANENEVTALVSDGSNEGWRPIIKRNVQDARRNGQPVLDLRDTATLATYKNGFGARANPGGSIVFDRVQAGYFGEAGLRDPHVVQYADGSPYIKDNKLYFTFTNAGLGFFEKAHWGVWTMDLKDYTKLEQVGNIFWTNEGDPTKVLGHHAGQIVRDEEEDRWIVLTSSWGDFGPQGGDGALTPGTPTENPANPPVDILYAELPLSTDVLRGLHILEGIKHPVNALPRPTEGKWDPGLTRIDGVWYLPYVIANDLFTDFQPALARSLPDADHTELVFVGTDDKWNATEGPILQKLGGEWRVFASNGDDTQPTTERGRYPIYDLNMVQTGYLDAPHPTNIPHPMIVPLRVTIRRKRRETIGRTKYIMVTFNGAQFYEDRLGYGTHGDFFVFEATQQVRGHEFG